MVFKNQFGFSLVSFLCRKIYELCQKVLISLTKSSEFDLLSLTTVTVPSLCGLFCPPLLGFGLNMAYLTELLYHNRFYRKDRLV